MNKKELDALVARLPADPFTIHMRDGSTYDINSPDVILVGKVSVCVLVPSEDDVDIYERLSLPHMVRIEHQVPRSA